MHTMLCSHHSTIFLNDFKFYPSFSSFSNRRYINFHLSPNGHSFLFFDSTNQRLFTLDLNFFWLSSFLFFSHSLIVSLIFDFFYMGRTFIDTLEFFFSNFLCPQGFLFLSTIFCSFLSLNLSHSQDQKNLISQTRQPSQRLAQMRSYCQPKMRTTHCRS